MYAGPFIDLIAILALKASVSLEVCSQAVRRKLFTVASKSDKIAIFAFFTTSKCCLKAIRVVELAVSIRVHDKVLLALQASFVCGFRAIGVSAFTVIELKIEFTAEAVSCYNVAG